jgi:hypothetical protein
MNLCDFCSGQPVVVAYPCRDFTISDVPVGSTGAWAACADCAQLIDADQRDALAWRAVDRANRNLLVGETGPVPVPADELFAWLRTLHELFFAHRTGPSVPVGLN